MQIVSVSKSPILSDFATLKTLYHEHKEEKLEAFEFNFFADSKIFVEVANKMQCANFYQVSKKIDDTYKLSLVRRINCPKVFCVGCPKVVNDELALGYVTGNVKVLNVKTMETVHKFTAGRFTGLQVYDFKVIIIHPQNQQEKVCSTWISIRPMNTYQLSMSLES